MLHKKKVKRLDEWKDYGMSHKKSSGLLNAIEMSESKIPYKDKSVNFGEITKFVIQ